MDAKLQSFNSDALDFKDYFLPDSVLVQSRVGWGDVLHVSDNAGSVTSGVEWNILITMHGCYGDSSLCSSKQVIIK